MEVAYSRVPANGSVVFGRGKIKKSSELASMGLVFMVVYLMPSDCQAVSAREGQWATASNRSKSSRLVKHSDQPIMSACLPYFRLILRTLS